MRHFEVAERRRRLLVRHHLARPIESVEDAVGDVVGIHSSDPATVYLSLYHRVKDFRIADLDAALYQGRTLARILGMRRTLFVYRSTSSPLSTRRARRPWSPESGGGRGS